MLNIVIVNYNSSQYLYDCLTSLRGIDANIHIVDNASTDPGEESALGRLTTLDKRVLCTRNRQNIGFGPAVNRKLNEISLKDEDIIWILNPDTTASGEACHTLTEHIRKNPRSIASPVIVTGQNGEKTWFAGGHFSQFRAQAVHFKKPLADDLSYDVSFLSGASLMMTAGTWRQLGGFREDLFMYWEDVDLSQRAKALNITLSVLPAATIWHRVGASTAAQSVKSTTWYYYMFRNRLIVCAKRRSQIPNILFGRGVKATLTYIYMAFRDPGPAKPRLKAIAKGINAGSRSVGKRNDPSEMSPPNIQVY